MIARVVERRRLPRTRPPRLSPELAAGTGWVALVPDLTGGLSSEEYVQSLRDAG